MIKKKIGIVNDCKVKYKSRKLHLIKTKIGIMTKVKYKELKIIWHLIKKKIWIIDDCKVKYKNRKLKKSD